MLPRSRRRLARRRDALPARVINAPWRRECLHKRRRALPRAHERLPRAGAVLRSPDERLASSGVNARAPDRRLRCRRTSLHKPRKCLDAPIAKAPPPATKAPRPPSSGGLTRRKPLRSTRCLPRRKTEHRNPWRGSSTFRAGRSPGRKRSALSRDGSVSARCGRCRSRAWRFAFRQRDAPRRQGDGFCRNGVVHRGAGPCPLAPAVRLSRDASSQSRARRNTRVLLGARRSRFRAREPSPRTPVRPSIR